jgi:hypothetical protein
LPEENVALQHALIFAAEGNRHVIGADLPSFHVVIRPCP